MLLIIIPVLTNAQVTENDIAIFSVRGPVLSMQETAYEVIEEDGAIRKGKLTNKGMSVDGLHFLNYLVMFNKQGSLILSNNYRNEKLIDSIVYTYDSSNNLIKREKHKIDNNSHLVLFEEQFSQYNLNGNLIEKMTIKVSDSIITKTTFRYDNRNNCIEENVFSNSNPNHTYPNLDIVSKHIRKYNLKGNLIKTKYYDTYFKLRKEVLRYNHQGQLTKRKMNICRRKGGKSTTRYSYNEKGELIETMVHDKGSDKWKKDQYDYDESGNIILHFSNSFKNVENTLTYEYDSLGNKTLKTYVSDKHDVSIIKESIYEYDTAKNWTKRIDFIDGKATLIIEREFTYY